MASDKTLELRDMSVEELRNELENLSTDYAKMKFEHGAGRMANPLNLRFQRKDIARINTEIRRRELEDVDLADRTKIRARRRRNK